jgi:hypothetical protein
MKKIILFLTIAFVSTINLNAQQKEKAVEKAVLTYIENFFENNFDKMNSVLHPRLSKRGLNPDGTIYKDLPPAELMKMLSNKKPFPKKMQKNSVEGITIFGRTATARLNTGQGRAKWAEFIHLIKVDGQWKIIDIFWEYFPREKGGKGQKRKKKN